MQIIPTKLYSPKRVIPGRLAEFQHCPPLHKQLPLIVKKFLNVCTRVRNRRWFDLCDWGLTARSGRL